MTLHEFNLMTVDQLKQELFNCCGATAWVNRMLRFFPMEDLVELLEDAEEQWYACSETDWLEAFSHHPKIGDTNSLQNNFTATAQWAAEEQGVLATAPPQVITALEEANKVYYQKFGYIFIVCATGKSAEEMLDNIQNRFANDAKTEIRIAMDEQNKITLLRLQKLLQ